MTLAAAILVPLFPPASKTVPIQLSRDGTKVPTKDKTAIKQALRNYQSRKNWICVHIRDGIYKGPILIKLLDLSLALALAHVFALARRGPSNMRCLMTPTFGHFLVENSVEEET